MALIPVLLVFLRVTPLPLRPVALLLSVYVMLATMVTPLPPAVLSVLVPVILVVLVIVILLVQSVRQDITVLLRARQIIAAVRHVLLRTTPQAEL